MSKEHSEQHEQELMEWLEVQPLRSAAFEESPWADCPQCRALAEELRAVDAGLGALGQLEEDVLTDQGGTQEALSPRLEEHVRGLAERGSVGERVGAGPRPSLWLLGLAAAVLVGAFLFWQLRSGSEGETQVILDGGSLRLLEPVGAVSSWGTFRWEGEFPDGAWFVVEVYDTAGLSLDRSGELEGNSWTPDPAQRDTWPDRIEWQLEVNEFSAAPRSSSAEAWLQP